METLQTTFTRQNYLNNECTHREYYGQYVTGQTKSLVLSGIGNKQKLIEAFAQDQNFNSISLDKWDRLVPLVENNKSQWKNNGDYYTLSGGICLLKEAARQIIES